VYLTIELADAKDGMLNLKHDGRFTFSAKDHDEIQYGLHLELFGVIDVEACAIADMCHLTVPFPSLHDNLDAGYVLQESKVAVAPGNIYYPYQESRE
jgi:hypothetical protein